MEQLIQIYDSVNNHTARICLLDSDGEQKRLLHSMQRSFQRAYQPKHILPATWSANGGGDLKQQFATELFQHREWDDFSINDAAFVMGNYSWIPDEIWFYALPWMFEIILRAETWSTVFDMFIWKMAHQIKASENWLRKRIMKNTMQDVVSALDRIEGRWNEAYGSDALDSGNLLVFTKQWWLENAPWRGEYPQDQLVHTDKFVPVR